MAKKKGDLPGRHVEDEAYRIANAAFDSIITSLPDDGYFDAFDQILKGIEQSKLSYQCADRTFRFFNKLLKEYVGRKGDSLDRQVKLVVDQHLDSLNIDATNYFEDRILNDKNKDHFGDILVEMEMLLEDPNISTYFRKALESRKAICEKSINRKLKRAKLRRKLRPLDESKAEQTPEQRDAKAISDDSLDKRRKSEGKLDFRQIMVLLSELIPEFANADNTKKGKLIAAISPYESEKRISDEFSYINGFAKEHEDPFLC